MLCGLAIAVANIDEVIRLIRTAPIRTAAREALMARDWPAERHRAADRAGRRPAPPHATRTAPTACRKRRPAPSSTCACSASRRSAATRSATSSTKLADEIADYLDILRSRARILAIVTAELAEVKDAFATPRRTEILDGDGELDDEDLIEREDMVVTFSHAGYIKRVPLSTYRAQRRGGKGRSGMATRDEDFVTRLFVAKTHTPVLFFSSTRRRSTRRRSGGCRWRRPTRAARRWSTCCRSRRASGSPRSCRCRRTRRAGRRST